MTKELDKTTLTRLAWLTELRRQGHRQCDGAYFKDNKACAIGLLGETAGLSQMDTVFFKSPEDVGELAGLDGSQVAVVVSMNDGVSQRKHSFREIADTVESWFRD